MDTPEYPPNSDKSKREREPVERKSIERVTTGEVVRKKKGLGRRFSEVFIAGDMRSARDHAIFDVLLPAARDMVSDGISEYMHKLMFGNKARRRGGPTAPQSGATGYVSYNRYSRVPEPPPRALSRQSRSRFEFDAIVLETRAEAEQVLDQLYEVLSRYEVATVADLYNLVGIKPEHTDTKWGWTYLRGSGVSRVRDGYLLDIPEPEPLDN